MKSKVRTKEEILEELNCSLELTDDYGNGNRYYKLKDKSYPEDEYWIKFGIKSFVYINEEYGFDVNALKLLYELIEVLENE